MSSSFGSSDDNGNHTCFNCGQSYHLTHEQRTSYRHRKLRRYCPDCAAELDSQDRSRSCNQSPDHSRQYDNEEDTMSNLSHDETTYSDSTRDNRDFGKHNRSPHRYNRRRQQPRAENDNVGDDKSINSSDLLRMLLIFDARRSTMEGVQPSLPNITASSASGNSSPGRPDLTDAPFEWIGSDVNNIDDLIRLGRAYNKDKRVRTNLDMYQLSKLLKPLEELQDMIGMASVKETMFYMAIYHLQGLEPPGKIAGLYHTCIMGDSGLGKTELAGIICRFYHGIGLLKNPEPLIADKNNFEGKYLGHTADKVSKLVTKAREEGRALITDEAYMILDKSGKDSYAQQAIDYMVKEMGGKDDQGRDNGGGFIWITMGYEKAMRERFLGANDGFNRRFQYKLTIEEPDGAELASIFLRTCRKQEWKCNVDKPILDELFTAHRDYMPHHGGSVLNLLTHCKQAHSRRLLTIRTLEELESSKRVINLDDIKNGIESFGKNVAANIIRSLTRQDWECAVDEDTLNKLINDNFIDPTSSISNTNTTTITSKSSETNKISGQYLHTSDQIHSFIEHCKYQHADRLQKMSVLETLETIKKKINLDDVHAAISAYKKAKGKTPGESAAANFIRNLIRQAWTCEVDEAELDALFETEFDDPNTADTEGVHENMDTEDDTKHYMHTDNHIDIFILHCKNQHAERLQKLNALETLETTKKAINLEDIHAAITSYKKAGGKNPGEGDDCDHVKRYASLYT